MDKETKNNLRILLQEAAEEFDLEVYSLDFLTNQNPFIIKIIIKKTNEEDITLNDCSKFNNPASAVLENSNLYIYQLQYGYMEYEIQLLLKYK